MANTQGKHRINFLDFLLIILIIATVSAAIVSVIRSNPNRISGGDTEITYQIKCDMLDKTAAQNIQVGDLIYDNQTNQLLGTVSAVTVSDEIKAIKKIVTVGAFDIPKTETEEVPTGKVTVIIDVKATVWKNNGVYSVDNYRIAEGVEIAFHSTKFSYTGSCIKVTE